MPSMNRGDPGKDARDRINNQNNHIEAITGPIYLVALDRNSLKVPHTTNGVKTPTCRTNNDKSIVPFVTTLV